MINKIFRNTKKAKTIDNSTAIIGHNSWIAPDTALLIELTISLDKFIIIYYLEVERPVDFTRDTINRIAIKARIIPPTTAKTGPKSATVACVPVATLASNSLAV